jgi:hypothetical protein
LLSMMPLNRPAQVASAARAAEAFPKSAATAIARTSATVLMAFLPNRVLLGSYAHVARDELPPIINLSANRDGGVLIMSAL